MTHHMSIDMTPFCALYGYNAMTFMDWHLVIVDHHWHRIGFKRDKTYLRHLRRTLIEPRINKSYMMVAIRLRDHLRLETWCSCTSNLTDKVL